MHDFCFWLDDEFGYKAKAKRNCIGLLVNTGRINVIQQRFLGGLEALSKINTDTK
jgi:hypothetical protein